MVVAIDVQRSLSCFGVLIHLVPIDFCLWYHRSAEINSLHERLSEIFLCPTLAFDEDFR